MPQAWRYKTVYYDHNFVTMENAMEISAGEFKAKCLKLMDNVARTHEPLVITKHGKPVAMMVPVMPKPATPLFGYMAGTATVRGDIVAPLDVEWEAESAA
jgi:prevent-host-death family protein